MRLPAASVTTMFVFVTVRPSIGSEKVKMIGWPMSTTEFASGWALTCRVPATKPSGSPKSTVPVPGAWPDVVPFTWPLAGSTKLRAKGWPAMTGRSNDAFGSVVLKTNGEPPSAIVATEPVLRPVTKAKGCAAAITA